MRKGNILHKIKNFSSYHHSKVPRAVGFVLGTPALLLKNPLESLAILMVELQSDAWTANFRLCVILEIATPILEVGGTRNLSECRAMIKESPYMVSRL